MVGELLNGQMYDRCFRCGYFFEELIRKEKDDGEWIENRFFET